MGNNYVITISRKFGSGGRLIGQKLATKLGVPFFDKTIIELAAKNTGISEEFIEQSGESITNSFLFNMAYAGHSNYRYTAQADTPINDKVYYAQENVIKQIAAKGSCVIVGRCAEYILRNTPNVIRIFVNAKLEDRVQRAIDDYGIDPNGAEKEVKRADKGRANYYKFYTHGVWGDMKYYDLCINTSFTGIDPAVEAIIAMLKAKEGIIE
ncbi:MAG: cytidylate kinase-like family protein [Oscillospiraceae bacterium]|nr:cytidylate kinase-like family protein [Oscillospiraceae bacterium]